MGYAKGKGPRRCVICRVWADVETMFEHSGQYYCAIDWKTVKAATSARALRAAKDARRLLKAKA